MWHRFIFDWTGEVCAVVQPEMYDGESEADGEGDQASADVHVVLVRHSKDDDQQQESAEDLVCCQRVESNLFDNVNSSHFSLLLS